MIEPKHKAGESFPIQFIWQLQNKDFLRAVFEANILSLDPALDRYIIQLSKLIAGRQEDETGVMREKTEISEEYWDLIRELVGRQAAVAYESDDGQPLHLRLATLTREHPFFTRFD